MRLAPGLRLVELVKPYGRVVGDDDGRSPVATTMKCEARLCPRPGTSR